jgi:K+/H+ antiporter YhaU regulatory subunit KhtT
MGLAEHLSGEPEPCDASARCETWRDSQQELPPGCRTCKFAKRFPGGFNHWEPVNKGEKHPDVVKVRREAKAAEEAAKRQKRLARDKGKMEVQRRARIAERQTERNIIHATLNSGRANKDGDHVLAGDITLDTKLQTGNLNPVVHLVELDKVAADARRAGKSLGALVLRNKNGVGVVALFEEDFARLVKGLQ